MYKIIEILNHLFFKVKELFDDFQYQTIEVVENWLGLTYYYKRAGVEEFEFGLDKIIFKEKIEKVWREVFPIHGYVLDLANGLVYRVPNFLTRIYEFFVYDIENFIQRGRRGWSDGDWWNLDYYVSNLLVGMLKKLKKDGHGLPTWSENKSEKVAKKEWENILNNLIYTFNTAKKFSNGDIEYIPTTNKDKKKIRRTLRRLNKNFEKKHLEWGKHKVLTERESLKYEKGFDLLKKWFFALCD